MSTTVYLHVPCPKCRRELRIRPVYLGRMVACKHCDHSFQARSEDVIDPLPPPPAILSPDAASEAEASGKRIKELEAEIEQVRAHLSSQAAQHVATLGVLKERQDELAEAREQIKNLEEHLERVRDDARFLDRPNAEPEKDPREELDWLHSEMALLRLRALEADRLTEELATGRAETDRLRSALYEAEARVAREQATRFDPERQALQDQIEEHARALAESRAEADRLREALQNVERERDEAHRLAIDRTEIDQFREALDRARLDAESAARQIQAQSEQIEALQARLDAQHREHQRERDDLQRSRQAETARLAAELEEARRLLDALTRSNDELAAQVHALRAEHARQVPGPSPDPLEQLPPRPRPEAAHPNDPDAIRKDLEHWLSGARLTLDEMAARAERLEAEIRVARDDLSLLHRDLVLGQWDHEHEEGDGEDADFSYKSI